MAGGVFLPIVSEYIDKGTKRAIDEFKSLTKASDKANFALKKAALPAAAALTAVATSGFKAAQAASDLQEEQSKVGVVFGESARDVLNFSKNAAKGLGQSQTQALAAAGTFGTLGKAAGLTGADLSKFSNKFVGLASDLASFNNTSPEEAIQAIGAALRGEAEPIRRYGVLLNDATLRQKALELGLVDTTKKALDPQTKSLAAQAVILEQTTDAQGDFARTADGAANAQRILKAQVADATANIGKSFLPILEKLLPVLSTLAQVVARNSTAFAAVALVVGGVATAILVARGAFIAYRTIAIATTAVNTALAASGFAVQISTGVGIATAIAGAAALVGITAAIVKATKVQGPYADATGNSAEETGKLKNEIDAAKRATEEKDKAEVSAGVASEKAAAAAKKLADQLKTLRGVIRDDFATALDAAKSKLQEAQQEFSNLATTVSNSITGAFSFAAAQEAGNETGKSFLEALTDQVTATQDYAVKINRLLASGLSEDALQQVLAAGQTAGGAIADELLNGGADAITQANALTAKVQNLGTTVGQNAAVQFRSAGVTAGQQLVAGIAEVVSRFSLKLSSKKLSKKQLQNLRKNFGVDVDFLLSGSVPALANGGIVKATPGGTLALIGEGGRDEAVIPLDKAGGMGGGNTIIIQGAIDPISTARQIEKILAGQTSRFGY
jgi:hypothetical protein